MLFHATMNVLLLLLTICLLLSPFVQSAKKAKAKNKKGVKIFAKEETNATVDDVVIDTRATAKAHNAGVAHGNSLGKMK
ncbi:hypothetical protein niasHT_011711 [Heterodera trifolii]|uniref:Uncharacterized protein n=1 Tax=Heterodera trifolii TaxID=157864 RepID=A0ABD2KXV5_9BILA